MSDTQLDVAVDRAAPVGKRPTGIPGFDEITGGGLPEGRLTTLIGSPGAGKTVFSLQGLVNRAKTRGETGIFVTFEEPITSIRQNMASFQWDFEALANGKIRFVDARIPPETALLGDFDLSGLLASLSAVAAETGARDIVFDGIDMVVGMLRDEHLERRELMRMDAWIRQCGFSALITTKAMASRARDQVRGELLEYLTDCVVVLDRVSTTTCVSRTLRVDKFRGSDFVSNPFPVVMNKDGFDVVMLKGARSTPPAFEDRVSTGVARLDTLLGGGYLRGRSILVSGAPGTSKTSLAASFVSAACARGEMALVVSFDESGARIIANMRSIGLDLAPFVEAGLLRFESLLSNSQGPEAHFVAFLNALKAHPAGFIVIDPISSFLKGGHPFAEKICETLLDHAKGLGITILCTSLLEKAEGVSEISASQVSTIADTWIHVSYVAHEGERNRALTIIKARGTNHSNQVRELILDESGINLADVYVAEGKVLMGSARAQREAEDKRAAFRARVDAQNRHLTLDRELAELQARVASATLEFESKKREVEILTAAEARQTEMDLDARKERLEMRRAGDDTTTRAPL